MEKILFSNSKIRFQDCDPLNHLNNTKYIDYFLNARDDQILEHYKFDIFKNLKKNATSWVVGLTQIAYINPAKVNELVSIETKLIDFSDKSIKVEMIMRNNKIIKSIIWIKFIHFSVKDQKSVSHLDEHIELFKKVVYPIQEERFENRVLEIKNKANNEE